ncbi:transmembrane protein [Cavenderia fasciculata]|uniref:Transmembrane protein n=1 Tax=Cavenderia fasciculata TaxID=261658 RepID=F4Q6R1_CACFS|nr:uncharacterized protein DFA_09118 [Cavenderia fasciculata]EGG16571.1 transmembrane protein [Cavenderia fasciculata]|eukprot:XP_004354971.1 transmembrane protein [Cavenderia fasciculata]
MSSYFLSILVFLFYTLLFMFGTVCLACGLYYFAELVEEHSSIAKRVIRYTIFVITGLILFLYIFDDVSGVCILLSLASHLSYYSLLSDFPFVSLSSIKFIFSLLTLIISHCSWFLFFRSQYFPFPEIFTIFIFCVWLVPFMFFISLAANDTNLPYSSGTSRIIGVDSEYQKQKKFGTSLKSILGWMKKKTDDFTGASSNKHFY